MKTIRELQAALATIRTQASALRDEARANLEAGIATGGDLAAATKRDDEFKSRLAANARQVELLEADLAEAQAAAERERAAPAARSAISVRESWESDPRRGFARDRDFFQAVQHAEQSGKVPANLASLRAPRATATAGSDEQSGSSDSYGGYLIPKAVIGGVQMTAIEADPTLGRTLRVPMTAPTVLLNARVDKDHSTSVSGGLVVYRRQETGTVTAKRMQFEQIELKADPLMGLSYATEEVLRDSPVSFAAMLESGFRDEFAARRIKELLNGTGVGEFLGVNNTAAKVDVAKETGQAAATITRANILKMRARGWRYSEMVWLANHDTIPQLFGITLPGETVPMFSQDAQGVDRLYGRPIFFTEFNESVGTVGDLLLVNWTQYLEGEYEPIQGASSMHVRFVEHEQAFKFWTRNAGAPWWRTVLTPNKGSTLAPVVRLATRS